MKRFLVTTGVLLLTLTSSIWAAKLRVNGDNSWVAFINGEKVAEGNNWQVATVSEFNLSKGFAVMAIYVHDAEPGAAGRGGALADVILDDGTYFGSDKTWKANAGVPMDQRKDGWEKIDFDDSKWENATQLDQFGSGIWGFGAAEMRKVLNNPDSTAYWVWAGPNDVADDIYLRLTIGSPTAVKPAGKLATTWGKLKSRF